MSENPPFRRGLRPGDQRLLIRRTAKLPRTLGASALFSACYGNVGSSIYYALGVTAAVALGLTPLAFILAGCIFVTTALNYAEGTAAMPHAGGSSSFARRAFNEPLGFLVGWVQLLNYTATVSISAYTAIAYLGIFGRYVPIFRAVQEPHVHVAASVLLVAGLIVINVVGIQESSLLNLALALLDLGTQVVLVLLGFWLLFNIRTVLGNVRWGVAPTWGNFLASISIAMVSYTGIETISNMSEEVRNPGRAVPRATVAVIYAVLFVSLFLPTIGMSVFPVHTDAGGAYVTDLALKWKDDPVAGIVTFFPGVLAYIAGVWVALLAFTILVIATNAGLIGISRLSFSLASYHLFPSAFARLHPRFRTPWISILIFGVAAALLILPAQIDLMAAVYSLAATFAFATAHLAVMRLRFVAPHIYRPYRMPGNIRFGRASIPILSVVGALAIGSVFAELLAQNISQSTYIYIGWLALGVLAFAAYRRLTHQPLWEPLEAPPPQVRQRPVQLPRMPESARVHVGRRQRVAVETPLPDHATRPHAHEHRRRHPAEVLVGVVASVAVGIGAVVLDLSPIDPFGPRLGWSVGVVVVSTVSIFLLWRSRHEE
jgi:APA family basic amino acid/polyamine antiporter